MSDPGVPSVPESVFEDVEANPGLIKKWVTDSEFRQGLLDAEDPKGFAAGHDFTIQQETSDWIKSRIQAHGKARIGGEIPPRVVAA